MAVQTKKQQREYGARLTLVVRVILGDHGPMSWSKALEVMARYYRQTLSQKNSTAYETHRLAFADHLRAMVKEGLVIRDREANTVRLADPKPKAKRHD